MIQLLILLTLFSATPLQAEAPIKQDFASFTQSAHDRLPTLSTVKQTLNMMWQWCADLWHGLVGKLGFRRIPAVISDMYATRVAREKKQTESYIARKIPKNIAAIAGKIDCMEHDFNVCKELLKTESDEWIRKSLRQEMNRIDDEVDVYMDSVDSEIDATEDMAFRNRNADLIKFIQVLKSRSFLAAMLDD